MEPDQALAMTLLEDSPAGIALIDAEGRVGWVNRRLTRMLGVPSGLLLGADRTALARHGLERLLDKEGALTVHPPNAHTLWLHCERRPLDDAEAGAAEARFFLDPATCTPTSEGDAVVDSYWRHVTTDPITGLLNRRALLLALEPQVARTRRYGQALAAVAIAVTEAPIDEPRVIAVSRILNSHLRWADLVGVDNGLFLLALPETDLTAAGALVNKICAAANEADHGELRAALRFGMAEWRRGDDAARLLDRAREAAEAEPAGC